MNTTLSEKFARLTAVGLFAFCLASPAQDNGPVERVTAKSGKTLVIRGAEQTPLEKEATVGVAKVMTNALFKVKDGKERTLKDGQVLSNDGTLLNPDGTLMPVIDHVVMKNGRVVVVKDGEAADLGAEITLGDGTRVSPDGTIIASNGARGKLLDGQLRTLEGGAIASQDTVLLKDGKVMVQKDGSSFQVLPGRTLVMNDGTKVFGDGTVLKRDGTRITLVDGQVLAIEGVSRR